MSTTRRTLYAALAAAALAPWLAACQPRPAALTAEQRLERGREAYLAHCAMCHGDRGRGDGPLASELAALGGFPPSALNNPARLDSLGRRGVERAILEGGGHTGRSNLMPAWGERLGREAVDAIADFVMTLPRKSPPAALDEYLGAPPGVPEEGRRLYVYYCSGCHGAEGRGDGAGAELLRAREGIVPRDLTDSAYFANRSDEDLYVVISLGGGHAGKARAMPAWGRTFAPQEIKSLLAYLRAISRSRPPA